MSKWTRTVTGDAKPRIKKNMRGLYWCSDKATHRMGWGKTVKEAYEQWQLMDSKRFEIARKGVWYRAGCPPISSYMGG